MQAGDLVRYQHKYPDGMEVDWIGIVIDCEIDQAQLGGLFLMFNGATE